MRMLIDYYNPSGRYEH